MQRWRVFKKLPYFGGGTVSMLKKQLLGKVRYNSVTKLDQHEAKSVIWFLTT